MPLVLLAPGSREHLTWRDASVGQLPLAALLLLLLPLGLTFYALEGHDRERYQRHGDAKFETLTIESEKALQNRLSSYGDALLGAAGFIQGSTAVSREEWRTYVEAVRRAREFSGHQRHRLDTAGGARRCSSPSSPRCAPTARPDFAAHRVAASGPNYLVRIHRAAERQPRSRSGSTSPSRTTGCATANLARDSGSAAMSGPIVLVQDERRSLGLLLMYPVYRHDLPRTTLEQRRAALRGWTYAPFVARNFLDGLTHSQSSEYRLRIYDGDADRPGALIYGSDAHPGRAAGLQPAHHARDHAAPLAAGLGEHAGIRARRTLDQPAVHPDRRPGVHRVAGAAADRARRAPHRAHRADGRRAALRGAGAGIRGARGRQLRACTRSCANRRSISSTGACRTRPARSIRLLRSRVRRTRRLAGAHGGALGRGRRHRRSACGATTPPTTWRSCPACARSSGSTPATACAGSSRWPATRRRSGATCSADARTRRARCAAPPRRKRADAHAAAAPGAGLHRLHRLSTGAQATGISTASSPACFRSTNSSTARCATELSRNYTDLHPARGHGVLHQCAATSARRASTCIDRALDAHQRPALDLARGAHARLRRSAEILAALAGAGGGPAGGGAGGAVGALHPDLAAEVRASRASRWRSTPASSRAARTW